MDMSENIGSRNSNDLHVMIPTEFKLIQSLQLVESRNEKQAKKCMALLKKAYLPVHPLPKEDSGTGFFGYEKKSSFNRQHNFNERISIAGSQNINDSIISDTIPKINSTRSRKIIKVETLANLEREFNLRRAKRELSSQKITGSQKDYRDQMRLSSLFRDMRRGQEMHGIMWGRHSKNEHRKTVYLNTIQSDEPGQTLNTESDYIGRGATPIEQIYRNLQTQNSVSVTSEEDEKLEEPYEAVQAESKIEQICHKFEEVNIEKILSSNSSKIQKQRKSPRNINFNENIPDPLKSKKPVKYIMQRFEDYIIDENLNRKEKNKRSTFSDGSSLKNQSRFSNLAGKSSLTRGKANTFKMPKRRDADVKLKF